MRILVVGDFLKGSGLTNYLLNTYGEEIFDEYSIEYISYSNSDSLDSYFFHTRNEFYKITSITDNPLKHLKDWNKFFKNNRNKYDLIHFNYSASWNFFAVNFCKKFTNAKILIHSHNNYYSKQPNFFVKIVLTILNNYGRKIFNRSADKKLAASKDAANWLFGSNENVIIAHNGIDTKKFVFNESNRKIIRKVNQIHTEKVVLGFVGRLETRKNPFFCLELMKHLNEDQYELLIFGEGPLEKELKEYCSKYNIQNKVRFIGNVANIHEWYSVMDIFLFPSNSEGFGFVLLEAQVNGLLCLSSDKVPVEANVTKTVINLSTKHTDEWIEVVKKYSINLVKRKNRSELNFLTVENFGYSIKKSSRMLKDIIKSMF